MEIRQKIEMFKVCMLIVVCCCIMLCGCSSDSDPDMNTYETEDGIYIAFYLAREAKNSRTTGTGEYDRGETYESLITEDISLLFFDENHRLASGLTASDIRWIAPEDGGYAYTEPIMLTRNVRNGRYWIYVVANSGSINLNGRSTIREFSGIYKDADIIHGPGNIFKPDYFLMVNKQDNVTVADGANGAVMIEIDPHMNTGSYDDPIKVKIELERLASKVTVESLPAGTPTVAGKIVKGTTPAVIKSLEIEEFALINCASQINLIQQWKAGSGFMQGTLDMVLNTPGSDKTYPIDRGYYNRVSDDLKFMPLFMSQKKPHPLYCLENNSPYYEEFNIGGSNAIPKTKMKGRTTAVVFKAKAGLSTGTNRTFFRYKGELFCDPTAIRSEYPGELTHSDEIADLRAAGVEVFENGVVYYTYWIKDSNYTDGGDRYYAVIRNTWYKLGVTDIRDIGEDTPGGIDYDEQDPVDEYAAISVNIRVNPWKVIIPDDEYYVIGEDDKVK